MKKTVIMTRFLPLAIVAVLLGCSCGDGAVPFEHNETNSVYYWKTLFALDDTDYEFIKRHDIGRIYLRMFDVTVDKTMPRSVDRTVPNATVRFPQNYDYRSKDKVDSMAVVPVVYITLDALKDMRDNEGELARNIVVRVKNMCSYNEIDSVEGLQLDCDWTASTEDSFFRLCDSVRRCINEENLDWNLSSTIRLHQLSRKAPPVDYGVLMVYNTGNFDDPDEKNSIISDANVSPYLKYIDDYPLHLDVAYPTYAWQLLFRERKFLGLTNGIDLRDTTRFHQTEPNRYEALIDVPHNGKVIYRGDAVKSEESDIGVLEGIHGKIERRLSGKPHSNVLYHFDLQNFSKYDDAEIDEIYSTGVAG